jgi:hypothetical protein
MKKKSGLRSFFFSGHLNYPGISQEEETYLRLSYYSSNLGITQRRKAKTPKTGSVTARLAFVRAGKRDVTNFPGAPTTTAYE